MFGFGSGAAVEDDPRLDDEGDNADQQDPLRSGTLGEAARLVFMDERDGRSERSRQTHESDRGDGAAASDLPGSAPFGTSRSAKGDGDEERSNPRKRRRLEDENPFATIQTASAHIERLMNTQIGRANEESVAPNVAAKGDNAVRDLFYTLLPAYAQRQVLLGVMSSSRAYPRIRALFGSPPYAFLRPGDAGIVRAAGFSISRRHMAYKDDGHVLNYSQFGIEHLVDSLGRQYRVVQDGDPETAPVAVNALPSRGGERPREFVVRIKKRTRGVRSELMKTVEGRQSLSFPRPGEIVVARPTVRVCRMLPSVDAEADRASSYRLRVVVVRVADNGAATARLQAEVL